MLLGGLRIAGQLFILQQHHIQLDITGAYTHIMLEEYQIVEFTTVHSLNQKSNKTSKHFVGDMGYEFGARDEHC
jgi:hypothetical protein